MFPGYQLITDNHLTSSPPRETEAFESVSEDDQLPQVVDELHDVHISPGSPVAKMQLRVKGELNSHLFLPPPHRGGLSVDRAMSIIYHRHYGQHSGGAFEDGPREKTNPLTNVTVDESVC